MSENTSSIGKPDISFTLNNDPLKLSVTLNNSPLEPCTVNTGWADPEPIMVKIEPDVAVLNEPEMRVVPATSRDAVAEFLFIATFP